MAEKRPAKYIRLNFTSTEPAAGFVVFGEPAEARIYGSERSFISVKEDGITISPGTPGKINLQALPGSITYGGMVTDTPFPLGLVPSPGTPQQVFNPPMKELLPMIQNLAILAGSFVGV